MKVRVIDYEHNTFGFISNIIKIIFFFKICKYFQFLNCLNCYTLIELSHLIISDVASIVQNLALL